MAQHADPLPTRAATYVIHGGVHVLAWACRYLARLLLARTIVAVAVIVASLTLAVYALWIGAIVWMVTGRLGILRPGRWRPQVEAAVALAAIASLVALCASGGRSPTNLAVIASCALGGAIVWLHRDTTLRALSTELHTSLGHSPAETKKEVVNAHTR